MELFKQMAWAEEFVQIYHFRDKRKNEVDVVLELSDSRIVGIEVKASSTIREQDFKGLNKLGELVGEQFKYGIIFFTGSRLLPFASDKKLYFAIPLSLFWL
jgi:predicted AAA+ superfamily ATPase